MMFLHKMIELFFRKPAPEKPPVTNSPGPFSSIPLGESSPYYSKWYNKPAYINNDKFYSNLVKTIGWTEKIIAAIPDLSDIDYSRVLRSTNPLIEGRPFYTYASDNRHEFPITPWRGFDYRDVLDDAMALRSEMDLTTSEISNNGKILVFITDVSTEDGAPVVESAGFVDGADVPPIDTWFYVTKEYLYCWIPTLFVRKMQLAIDVEMLDSYRWLEQVDPEFNERLLDRLKSVQKQ